MTIPTIPTPPPAFPAGWPTQQPTPQPAGKPPRRRKAGWIAGLVGTGILGIVIGANSAGSSSTPTQSTHAAAPTTVTVTQPPVTVTATPANQAPQSPAAPAGLATSFGDGQFKAGVDIQPGHYKTAGPASGGIGMCYVEVAKDDSGNLESIVTNDNPSGPKQINVTKGQYVTNQGCQTFTKVG